MSPSCIKKQEALKQIFSLCRTQEEKYQKIIEMGKDLLPLKTEDKTAEHLVKGCQSRMYLRSTLNEGKMHFEAESDALISAGLAALLIKVYEDETPETVLTCPPNYLEEIGISNSLTPNRANGLYSVHLRMKQDALKFLMQKQ